MGAQSFKLHSLVLSFVLLALSICWNPQNAWAQTPIVPDPAQGTPSTEPKSLVIESPSNNYDIQVDMGQPSAVVENPTQTEVYAPWNRLAGGLFLGLSNTGVINGIYRITDDKIMNDKSSEFGYGGGAYLDFPNPSIAGSNMRFRIGAYRMTFDHGTELEQQYGDSLEKSATLFHLGALLRFPLPMALPLGHFWFGFGGQMNYALSTKKPGNASPDSKLVNTYAFDLLLSAGTDIPLTSYNDISFQFDYHPMRGYSVLAGLRTSL